MDIYFGSGCIYCPQKTCFYSFTCQNISCIVLMKGYCIILNLCLNVLHVAYAAVNIPLKTYLNNPNKQWYVTLMCKPSLYLAA